jgi:hypothetical protein
MLCQVGLKMSVQKLDFESFCSGYDTEDDCVRALYEAKWPQGFRCQRCDHRHAHVITTRKLPLFQCASCRKQTSLIAGTVLEGSRTPLRLWFQAIYLHARPQSINALQLSRVIGVTYKTAWLICHKLRYAMSLTDSNTLLTEIVRVSDAVYCSRYTPSPDWHIQEQPLLIGTMENKESEIVHIKIKKQSKQPLRSIFVSPETAPFIRKYLDPTTVTETIVTRRIGKKVNRTLLRICYEAERWLAWTFRGIGVKHLQVYLDHYCYLWNRRNKLMFPELLRDCAVTPSITYPDLIRSSAIRSSRLLRKSDSASRIAG